MPWEEIIGIREFGYSDADRKTRAALRIYPRAAFVLLTIFDSGPGAEYTINRENDGFPYEEVRRLLKKTRH